ncbi:TPA: hypothetical protein ACGO2G_001137 [Streptococcus suis]
MSSNLHGFNNESQISEYLNGKKFKELNTTMKQFIKYVSNTLNLTINDETEIKSDTETNNKVKQDIYLYIDDKKIGVSVKLGSGNSVHQEKIEEFITFIKDNCNASEEICDLWKFFIWADGTLDGTGAMEKNQDGNIISRFTSAMFKKKYPDKRQKLLEFIEENKLKLIERVVFVGKNNSSVEFIYHGTEKQGSWISKKEALDYMVKLKPISNRACLPVGHLTIQAWNVSLQGNTEQKRGEIQFKYGCLQSDLETLLKKNADTVGTFLGDLEEYGLTHVLNKNKNNKMWKTLFPNEVDFSDYYAVKVSTNQFSALSNKKVKTKSDAYIIKAKLDRQIMLEKQFVLDESDLKNFEYEIVPGTGISIKMKNSKHFTYQKFTSNSFKLAFSDIDEIEFWLVSLLVYSTDKERYKNEHIITDFGYERDQYFAKVREKMKIEIIDPNSKFFWDSVRHTAQTKIKEKIQSNSILKENIFMGKYWFKEPYHAMYIFENGSLKENTISDFSITTGSGRSKGKYTIEIK